MKHVNLPLRPGMTAIAAALALSSTPLFAQDASLADPAPPMIAAPPPAPAPVETVQSVPPAASTSLNIPQISVNMDDAPGGAKEAAAPVNTQRANNARADQPQPVERAEVPRTAVPFAPKATMPVENAQVAPEPPVPLTPPETTMVPPPVEPAAPVPATAEIANVNAKQILPVAGGILGALALIGGGLAFAGRRRRHRETLDADTVTLEEPLALTVSVNEQPLTARGPVAAPATGQATTSLPAGFDITRFGPHVQAAYRGPTPDNPSMSLRMRLKRARFYDQRARMSAASAAQSFSPVAPPQAPEVRPERKTEHVTSRRLGTGNVGFRPAFQN